MTSIVLDCSFHDWLNLKQRDNNAIIKNKLLRAWRKSSRSDLSGKKTTECVSHREKATSKNYNLTSYDKLT